MKTFRQLIILLSITVLLAGCGYSHAARNGLIPRGQTVDIRMFANRTYLANIEGEFRSALVGELVSRGYSVGSASPDYLIGGEIASLSIDSTAFSAVDRVMMYGVVVEIQMQVSETKSGKVVWKGTETVREEYPAASNLALQRNAREAAVKSVCIKAAQLLTVKMNQDF